jgi:hypothetical protein
VPNNYANKWVSLDFRFQISDFRISGFQISDFKISIKISINGCPWIYLFVDLWDLGLDGGI